MKPLPKNVLLLLVSLSVSLIAVETVLRLRASSRLQSRVADIDRLVGTNARFNDAELKVNWNTEISAYDGRRQEARDHFAAIKSLKLAYRPYVERRRLPDQSSHGVNINRFGYRGRDFSIEKDGSLRRVLVFGGSFVWGTGALTDEETIPGHLERLLNAHDPAGGRWEVINAGETGYVTSQEVNLLVHEGLLLRPDWVVFIDGYNDAHNVAHELPAGYPGHFWQFNELLSAAYKRPVEATLAQQRESLIRERELLWALSRELEISRLARLAMERSTPPTHVAGCEELAARHLHNLLIVEALSRAFGFETLFAVQPIAGFAKPLSREEAIIVDLFQRELPRKYAYLAETYECYDEALATSARERNLGFLSLTDTFEDDHQTRYIDFVHLTGDGYEKIAERLSAWMIDSLK